MITIHSTLHTEEYPNQLLHKRTHRKSKIDKCIQLHLHEQE